MAGAGDETQAVYCWAWSGYREVQSGTAEGGQ